MSQLLSISVLYQLSKEFVKFYPNHSLKCKRLNTFAVLSNYEDINTPNLSKVQVDATKPYFFSRLWAKNNHNPSKIEWEYPVMLMLDKTISVSNLFCKNTRKCYKFELAFLDKYDRNCVEKGQKCNDPCANRTINDIFIDTEAFLDAYSAYMSGVIYAYSGNWEGYTNQQVIIASGQSFTIDETRTKKFQRMLIASNSEATATRFSGGLDDAHGIILDLSFCINHCNEFTYDANSQTMKVGPDLNCCD